MFSEKYSKKGVNPKGKLSKYAKGGFVPRVGGKTVGEYYFKDDVEDPKSAVESARGKQDYDEYDRGVRFMEGPDGKNRAPGVEKAKDEDWSRITRPRYDRRGK